MPATCSASNCRNRWIKGQDRSFFKFPLLDPALTNEWVIAMGRPNFVPNQYSTLCSDHFLASDFRYHDNRRYIVPQVVPSVFEKLVVPKTVVQFEVAASGKLTSRAHAVKPNPMWDHDYILPNPQKLMKRYEEKVAECRNLRHALTASKRRSQQAQLACAKLRGIVESLKRKLSEEKGLDPATITTEMPIVPEASTSNDRILKDILLKHMRGFQRHNSSSVKTYVIM